MKKLIFATNNLNKLKEIHSSVDQFDIVSLKDLDIDEEIPETGKTLRANALQKAQFIYNKTGLSCFADDTGLEIDYLNGRPGVYSARYAGEKCSVEENMNKVLFELTNSTNRNAVFKTVIALIIDGNKYFFEGKVEGVMLKEKSGIDGFGYDPIFRPNGFNQTFAEMSMKQKNEISHRGIAVRKLIEYLNKYNFQ